MVAIGIRYLCGWSMATHPANRQRPEWPPHPDRIFMALSAAHFETGAIAEERETLLWLEAAGPPALTVARHTERTTVTTFVPVNDTASPLKGSGKTLRPLMAGGSMGIGRDRQPRQYPVAIPDNEIVYLHWDDTELPSARRRVLDSLCQKVTCLGHSASLVQMWVEDDPPAANLVPVCGLAKHRLRVPGPGRLNQLVARYEAGLRPTQSLWTGYAPRITERPSRDMPGSSFDDELIVLRQVDGRSFGLESTLRLTEALRGTLLTDCPDQPPPEWLTGHQPDGSPSGIDHVALLPLPHVGRKHADGHLLGLAIAVPGTDIDRGERARCLHDCLLDELGFAKDIKLTMGALGSCVIKAEEGPDCDRPTALQSSTWVRAAETWATVSPIVLDRHAKTDNQRVQIVAGACQRIGLPDPVDIQLTFAPPFMGSGHARRFPPLPAKFGKSRRAQFHAVITFPGPVCGPVLLGAGRYRGYGLCRPWSFAEVG